MKNAETPVFKLVLFGPESSLGNALMVELLSRQHEVIAVVDDLNRHSPRPGLHFKIGGWVMPTRRSRAQRAARR